jgi:hypothetical protein
MNRNLATALLITAIASLLTTRCGKPDSPANEGNGANDQTGAAPQGSGSYMEVKGVVGYASQCPSGAISAVTPVPIAGMYDCPIGLNQVELEDAIEPIYLSVDCKNRIISARTADRRIDTAWNALPDNTFFFTLDGLKARLKTDGTAAHNDCETPLSVDFMGKLQCDSASNNRDQVDIQFEAVMWTSRPSTSTHTPSTPASPVPVPSTIPSSIPISFPTSLPTGDPGPFPTPTPSSGHGGHHLGPFPWPFPWPMDVGTSAGTCNLPKSCYFYVQTDVKQCQP